MGEMVFLCSPESTIEPNCIVLLEQMLLFPLVDYETLLD